MKKDKKEGKNQNSTVPKAIFWTPRILAMCFILFVSLFALDIFEMNLGFWGTIVGLFMHLIPSFALIIILIISWKYEIVGTIAFILAGIFYIIMVFMNSFEWYMLSWILTIAVPLILTGILFWVNWHLKRKNKKSKRK
ncbi:hypothetical protein J4465_00190 [Candidatus Pacearchaeota archaeon]|nr:hypothetical protein [Candidatus Pacearchaeota archaeon]